MKSGCVGGAQMLQRGDMMKLPRDSYGGEAKFTQVQELKQDQQRANLFPPSCLEQISEISLLGINGCC